jgi:hypothetical protein
MLWRFLFFGLGVGSRDGINWDERHREQVADTCVAGRNSHIKCKTPAEIRTFKMQFLI